MSKLYSTIKQSVVRAIVEMIEEIEATAPTLNPKYQSWENRLDEDKLPRQLLIGLNGYSWEENGGLWTIRFGITISTVDDANLINEDEVIDIIHEHFGEKKKVALVALVDEVVEEFNELVSVDFQVLPMTPTQMRNYRTIGIELKRTGT